MDVKELSNERLETLHNAIYLEKLDRLKRTSEDSGKANQVTDAGCATERRGGPEPFTLENIDTAMAYQAWGTVEREAGDQVREALTAAAKVILRTVVPSRYRDKALDGIVQVRMDANAAISFRGRF